MTSNPLPKHGPHKPGSVGRAQGLLKVRVSAFWPFVNFCHKKVFNTRLS